MLVVNYSTLREKMKTLFDRVTNDYEVLTVTRKNNPNVVVLSEKSYNNLLENVYIRSDKTNYDWLIASKKQYEDGILKKMDLD